MLQRYPSPPPPSTTSPRATLHPSILSPAGENDRQVSFGQQQHEEEAELLLRARMELDGTSPTHHFTPPPAQRSVSNSTSLTPGTENELARIRNEALRFDMLIGRFEKDLRNEKLRHAETLRRVGELHAQRFVLALVCAVAVPSLVVSLIAHKLNLYELENRLFSLGALLVVCGALAWCAKWLWVKGRLMTFQSLQSKVKLDEQQLPAASSLSSNNPLSSPAEGGLRQRKPRMDHEGMF